MTWPGRSHASDRMSRLKRPSTPREHAPFLALLRRGSAEAASLVVNNMTPRGRIVTGLGTDPHVLAVQVIDRLRRAQLQRGKPLLRGGLARPLRMHAGGGEVAARGMAAAARAVHLTTRPQRRRTPPPCAGAQPCPSQQIGQVRLWGRSAVANAPLPDGSLLGLGSRSDASAQRPESYRFRLSGLIPEPPPQPAGAGFHSLLPPARRR